MKFIENLDSNGFYNYLASYRNTICGRHPISVMLNVSLLFFYSNFCLD